jgi:hypothetical protein
MITTLLHSTRGHLHETAAIQHYEVTSQTSVTDRNDKTFKVEIPIDHAVYANVHLFGKVDGIKKDPNTGKEVIVEVKNRQNNLFDIVPLYP